MIAIDIFPVEKAAVPPINAYALDTSENSISISGKLAYRLRKQFGGHWSANYGRILSDKPVTDQQLNDFLRQLWKSNNVSFRNVRSMRKAAGQGLSEIDIAMSGTELEHILSGKTDLIELLRKKVRLLAEEKGFYFFT